MIYEKDWRFYQQALKLARNGEHRVRVGCLAVNKGKPIAGAFNTIRNTSPVKFKEMTWHAEETCVDLVPDRIISSTLFYIARLSRDDQPLPSAPCERCRKVLEGKIKGICYLGEDGILIKEAF